MRLVVLGACGLAVAACASPYDAWPMPASATPPLPAPLGSDPRTHDGARDRDGDCLDDDAEHAIAQWFTPYFRFDTRENARREPEPVVLYQVTSSDACTGGTALELRYAYLFVDDGGYVASTSCHDAHHGDNQYIRAGLHFADAPPRAEMDFEIASGFYWPRHDVRFEQGRHAVWFLSGGKHHPYPDARVDGRASPYSSWGCVEAMDGAGALVATVVDANGVPRGMTNVGERTRHPSDVFVNDLSALGFAGEQAWGTEPFCGFRPREGCTDEVSTMDSVWR